MKTIIPVAYLLLITSVAGESNENLLLKLSVACQNAQSQFEKVPPDGSIDPSFVTGYIKTINTSLDALVDSGLLTKTDYVLKNPADMTEKELNSLFGVLRDVVGKLYLKYGHYTAMEMVDLGAYRRISTVKKEDTFTVRIRVPKEYMGDLDKKIQPFLKKKSKTK